MADPILISTGPSGIGNGFSAAASNISADGRFVAFQSEASNLVAGDTNGVADGFLRDNLLGTTTLVSTGPNGIANGETNFYVAVSDDGRFVAFDTDASNLVAGDTNGSRDVFLRDLVAGTTTLISVGTDGGVANNDSGGPSISADGRFVAFDSDATNIVQGGTTGFQIFVRDLLLGTNTLVSVGPDGPSDNVSTEASISADGRFVAFTSDATNLVPGTGNGAGDSLHARVFVRDLLLGTTALASTGLGVEDLASFFPRISADGRFVVFETDPADGETGSSGIYARDLQTQTTIFIGVGPGIGGHASISGDGRLVAFGTPVDGLAPGDTNGREDTYVKDLQTGALTLVSTGPAGIGNGDSGAPVISADGRFVAFGSLATNLIAGDTNHQVDDFLVALPQLAITGISRPTNVVSHIVSGTIDIADAGQPVTLRDGDTVIGTAPTDAAGNWTLPLLYLGDGFGHAYSLTASATDVDGRPETSSVVAFTLDFTPNLALFGSVTHDNQSHAGEIYALFDGLLARVPDASGWESLVPALDHGASPHDIAQTILASAEWTSRFGDATRISDQTFVDTLYQVALGRGPDQDGGRHYIDALHAGTSRADVALAFAVSGENERQLAGAFSAGVFVPDGTASDVARLYEGILHRSPEGAGLQFWVDKTHAGTPLKTIAQNFLDFSEYGQLHPTTQTDQQYVQDLYQNALGRLANDAGAAGWVAALSSRTLDRADVAIGIAESAEAHTHLAGHVESGWHLY